ncbi:LOW QUALITY PROTEIN: methyl-CpG-binding domain protein 1-like [Sminthopsis crassicaudata]|uniref:LOW QUALITY PROTEIN: methyl-CpG-binding domain protein 1-like n=1 Tax=Sminthopsis crassicaudata TaxID=9301 RepID=UPI003D699D1A
MAPKPSSREDPKATKRSPLSRRRFSKAEDWFDCPALGPGWKRRENFRKKGATCGLSDTYYLSPSGDRIRSKVELARYLGPGWDLSGFHFKLGILQPSPARAVPPQNETKRPRRGPGRPRKETALSPLEQPDSQMPLAGLITADGVEAPEPRDPAEAPHTDPTGTPSTDPAGAPHGDSADTPRSDPADVPRSEPAGVPRSDPASAPRSDIAEAPQSDRNGHPRRRWRQRWLQTQGCEAQRSDPPGAPADPGKGSSGRGTDVSSDITEAAATVPRPGHDPLLGECCARGFCPPPPRLSPQLPRRRHGFWRRGLGSGCGLCSGCLAQEDCGVCWICAREGKPGLIRRWRCLARRCLQSRLKKKPKGSGSRKGPGRRRKPPALPPPEQVVSPVVIAPRRSRRPRSNRKCGVCAACLRLLDCGECDFCLDKPKFGGSNQKRQKCRWRQCLTFAVKRLLPATEDDSSDGDQPLPELPRLRKGTLSNRLFRPGWARARGRQSHRLQTETPSRRLKKKQLPVLKEELGTDSVQPQEETNLVILQGGESIPVLGPNPKPESSPPPTPDHNHQKEYVPPAPEVFSAPPQLKQEVKNFECQAAEATLSPPVSFLPDMPSKEANGAQPQQSVKEEQGLEEEAVASNPVIMEIYSLGKASPTAAGLYGTLDSVLQEFLVELNELPLPAHWEVLPTRGPDLCLIQRSILSTVAAAVIHIQPGLYFRVVVRDVPVPPTHELYSAHPLRLTTVDEVIELICDLEAYHLCPGWPDSWHQGQRSPVLLLGAQPCPTGTPKGLSVRTYCSTILSTQLEVSHLPSTPVMFLTGNQNIDNDQSRNKRNFLVQNPIFDLAEANQKVCLLKNSSPGPARVSGIFTKRVVIVFPTVQMYYLKRER